MGQDNKKQNEAEAPPEYDDDNLPIVASNIKRSEYDNDYSVKPQQPLKQKKKNPDEIYIVKISGKIAKEFDGGMIKES